jgi:cytochrome P450
MGLLLIAGHETTTSLVGSALHHLARETGDRAALADDPGRIPAAVEEFLRFAPPIHIFGRNATSDVTLHGQGIAEGDIVALAYGSANRDPRVFPDPNSFRLDRPSNRHMAFGTGPHFCIAAAVARLELAVLLERFLARVGDFGISDASDVWYKPRGDARGFARLPLSIHGAS